MASRDNPIALQEAEFFRALTPEQLGRVKPQLRESSFERAKVLFFEGAPADALWCVKTGEVRLYKSSSKGRITSLEILGPGEIFGAVSALDREEYPISAEGVTAGAAWCLPRSHFLRLLSEEPRLSRDLLEITTRRLQRAHERVRSFAHDPAPARLAQALLRASDGDEARVTRKDLAEAAGTTVETAIRTLRVFERNGVIRGSLGKIAIIDRPALQRLADG